MARKVWNGKWMAVVAVFLMLIVAVAHAEEERTASDGQWKYVLEDGGAKITAYVAEPTEDGYYEEPSGELMIPGELDGYPVTAIDEMVFWRCSNLTRVIIPDSVTSIGLWAFDECENLTGVVIPKSVTSIGVWSFIGWYDKLVLTVPEGSYAEQYAVENGIPYVLEGSEASLYNGEEAVAEDEELAPDEELASDEEIRPDAGGQWQYSLRDGGAVIEGYIVEPSGELTIPAELDGYPVTGLGFAALELSLDLTGVTFPDSVKSIGDNVFWGCESLTAVTISEHVTSIGINPFGFCGLTEIDVSPFNPNYAQLDGILYDKQMKTLLSYPAARRGEFSIPEGVEQIGHAAFEGCRGLTGITIPTGVTQIGEEAFLGCSGLSAVVIPDSITRISDHAFDMCDGLTSVTIPSSVTAIGNCAFFDCAGLTGIDIPESVNRIDYYAFAGCTGLQDVTLPAGVTCVDEALFYMCGSLTKVTLPRSVTSIGEYAFYQCVQLTELILPDNVSVIGENAFDGCSGLTSLTIPASVTSIGALSFKDCVNLTLGVAMDSYAEQYAKDNGIPYVYPSDMPSGDVGKERPGICDPRFVKMMTNAS